MARLKGRIKPVILTGLIGIMSFPVSAAKLISCWVNDHGIRECGASVPPEHSQKRIEIVNERGLVVKVIPAAKTKEQLARDREQALIAKEKEDRKKEQARQDAILLNAYTTERDLIIARDNNLKAIEGQIEISKGNLHVLKNTLNQLQQQAANYERSGKKPPESLLQEIEETKTQIQAREKYVVIRENERNEMAKRYERDLTRFRELKD